MRTHIGLHLAEAWWTRDVAAAAGCQWCDWQEPHPLMSCISQALLSSTRLVRNSVRFLYRTENVAWSANVLLVFMFFVKTRSRRSWTSLSSNMMVKTWRCLVMLFWVPQTSEEVTIKGSKVTICDQYKIIAFVKPRFRIWCNIRLVWKN